MWFVDCSCMHYINNMKNETVWGTTTELLSFASMLQIPIFTCIYKIWSVQQISLTSVHTIQLSENFIVISQFCFENTCCKICKAGLSHWASALWELPLRQNYFCHRYCPRTSHPKAWRNSREQRPSYSSIIYCIKYVTLVQICLLTFIYL